MAADDDILVVVTDLAVEFAVHRVPFKEMGKRARVSEVVNRANALDLFLRHGAKHVAPNTTEPVDSEICHRKDVKRLKCKEVESLNR